MFVTRYFTQEPNFFKILTISTVLISDENRLLGINNRNFQFFLLFQKINKRIFSCMSSNIADSAFNILLFVYQG
jgi:hypothetical protein